MTYLVLALVLGWTVTGALWQVERRRRTRWEHAYFEAHFSGRKFYARTTQVEGGGASMRGGQ